MKTVNVLGEEWGIEFLPFEKYPERFKDCFGYCLPEVRRIVICDLFTHPDWANESASRIENHHKYTKRHEITHAFLAESGLRGCSLSADGPWAYNEEMVDWLSLQGQKVYKAWEEADAL